MDYFKIYNNIISKAKSENRKKDKDNYYENHHIIPKSLGGDNSKENLVLLSAREHFIAHKCLVKIYENKDSNSYFKMCIAMNRFMYSKNSNEYKISSRDYETYRKLHALGISNLLSNRCFSEEHKKSISLGLKKYYKENDHPWTGKTHSEKTKEKMSAKQRGKNNPQYGKQRTEIEKEKISKTMKGHKKSKETIEKFKSRKWSEEKKKQISEKLKEYHDRRRREKAKVGY